MKSLLDTHTFIWWDSDPSKLSPRALAVLRDPAAVILLSVVSVWEILVKSHLGKLSLRLPLDPEIARVFTTAESVDSVLRALITTMPAAPQSSPRAARTTSPPGHPKRRHERHPIG
jgi:PIN domain nuclease of toxin-antitoxin system